MVFRIGISRGIRTGVVWICLFFCILLLNGPVNTFTNLNLTPDTTFARQSSHLWCLGKDELNIGLSHSVSSRLDRLYVCYLGIGST